MRGRGFVTKGLLAALVATLSTPGTVEGSGVGASYFQPGVIAHTSPEAHTCATGACRPGAPCASCQRMGFACVDGTGPSPCTPDGACRPARQTFGFHQARWRRWPGDYDTEQSPTPVDTGDSLLKPFDAPAPKDEDVQAPPKIDTELPDEENGLAPAGERDLPAMPEPKRNERRILPERAPQPDAPPALPFGAMPSRQGPTQALPPLPDSWRAAPGRPALTPVSAPAGPRYDAPPALPQGFTSINAGSLPRRLPTTASGPGSTILDPSVRAASATQPLR
jgi:hypothetical protein